MGFKPGQEVTLDNALKMLMVKSANDLAITIAEGVAGSVENFAVQMNTVAARIGMRESHFVNPNGLHDPNHYSSARDMALVAMALYRDFPQYSNLYGIGAFRLGSMVVPTHNGLLGRYPGAEGMKTGFTCPAGFNVVASATHGGRRLIAVVLGFPNAKSRTIEAAGIMDAGFATSGSGRNVAALPTTGGAPPNMREQICGGHRQDLAEDDFAVRVAGSPPPSTHEDDSPAAFFRNDGRAAGSPVEVGGVAATQMALAQRPVFEPIDVYVGRPPGWTGPVVGPEGPPAKVASSADESKPVARKAAAKKPKVAAKPKGKTETKGKTAPKKVAAHAAGGKTSKKTTE
jgi:D-alanyl-D-alanine carboxypeptidase